MEKIFRKSLFDIIVPATGEGIQLLKTSKPQVKTMLLELVREVYMVIVQDMKGVVENFA